MRHPDWLNELHARITDRARQAPAETTPSAPPTQAPAVPKRRHGGAWAVLTVTKGGSVDLVRRSTGVVIRSSKASATTKAAALQGPKVPIAVPVRYPVKIIQKV